MTKHFMHWRFVKHKYWPVLLLTSLYSHREIWGFGEPVLTAKLPFFLGLNDPSRGNLVIYRKKPSHLCEVILCLQKFSGAARKASMQHQRRLRPRNIRFYPLTLGTLWKTIWVSWRLFFLRFFEANPKKDHRVPCCACISCISNELSRNMKARTSWIGIEKLREGIAQGNPFRSI